MISLDEARSRVLNGVGSLTPREVDCERASGLVLAHDVVAGENVPNPQAAVWSNLCGPVHTLTRPTPEDWHRWCRERLNKDLPLKDIEVLCQYITSPGKLAEALSNASA